MPHHFMFGGVDLRVQLKQPVRRIAVAVSAARALCNAEAGAAPRSSCGRCKPPAVALSIASSVPTHLCVRVCVTCLKKSNVTRDR